MLVVKGDRDFLIDIDFIDIDGIERKRWRQGGDTVPTATAQADVQALTKFRCRSFGNQTKAATKGIWGYAHQANAGGATGIATAVFAGTYSGDSNTPAEYELKITSVTTTTAFQWRKNGGSWSTDVTIPSASAVTIADGVTVAFTNFAVGYFALNDTYYVFSHYQRMIEVVSPYNVIEDVNNKDSTDFYRATAKLYYEGGISTTKPSMTLRNTKTSAYT
jgi:hypothetical protein